MIGIINAGIGNLGSLRHAVYNLGHDPLLISRPEQFADITHLILPGVGAFASAMAKLNEAGLADAIHEFSRTGRPLLGICLGMQLLASEGEEGGLTSGFGLVPGRVVPLKVTSPLRIPHVGWNEAHRIRGHPVLERIREDVDFYFVHSFRFAADSAEMVFAETVHGERFASIVGRDNVMGVQFHPEKSQVSGLRLLENFCEWSGEC
jgi:glutamine amidotransferase